jgi:hypothetical protein
MKRLLRIGAWSVTTVIVILLARTVAYAVSPSPMAELLQHRAGGPALPVLVVTALAAGLAVAIAITFLAWLGVRERALVERSAAPRMRIARMTGRAALLWCAEAVLGGLFEAYLHWRAGLGWHGLHCVFGPVHRNLLPIDAALSLIAAAVATALEHVVAWMRRTLQRLADVAPYIGPTAFACAAPTPAPRMRPRLASGGPRAPPRFF